MSERDAILRRIREALVVPAPRPGAHHGDGPPELPAQHDSSDFRPLLPLVGPTPAERLALFAKNSADLMTEFIALDDPTDLPERLREIAAREGWQSIASHPHPLLDRAIETLDCTKNQMLDKAALGSCDAGITACDALIAQTGSILVTSRSAGGRALSILPPHHVVIATRDQLLPDLPAAFALVREKYAADYPSMISLITGPSRTGDIERILVLGAHGPKKLTVLCA